MGGQACWGMGHADSQQAASQGWIQEAPLVPERPRALRAQLLQEFPANS